MLFEEALPTGTWSDYWPPKIHGHIVALFFRHNVFTWPLHSAMPSYYFPPIVQHGSAVFVSKTVLAFFPVECRQRVQRPLFGFLCYSTALAQHRTAVSHKAFSLLCNMIAIQFKKAAAIHF